MKFQVSSSALFEQLENVHKKILTPDQEELIRHQDEVLKSINTVSEYLQMYSNIYYLGRVDGKTLSDLHYVRDLRIKDARHAFNRYIRYAECRRRLVSTEKKFDVDFVRKPLRKAISTANDVLQRMDEARLHELRFHEIEAIGVNRQQIATQMRELKDVVLTIKDKLQEIDSEYQELYKEIYQCSAEDCEVRFNRQFNAVTGIHHVSGVYADNISFIDIVGSIIHKKNNFHTPWGDMVIDFSKPIKIKKAKDSIVEKILTDFPILEENDLFSPANMAEKMRDYHISFDQTNQAMLGLTCFHLLDRISQELINPLQTTVHRGRPKVNMYDYISKESLMASFPSYREEANKSLETAGENIQLRWNEFTALYLIALVGDAIEKIKGLAAGFVRCINKLFGNLLNLKICKDTVQNHINNFFEYLQIRPNDYDRYDGKRDYQAARWRMIIPMLRSWFQRDNIQLQSI